MGKRVMVLGASVGSGHTIAAGVLESCFHQVPDVEAVQALDTLELTSDLYRSFYDEAYFALVDAAPWLIGWAYDRNDPPFRDRNVVSLWDQLNTTAVVSAIRAYQPDVVVCTHFLPSKLISLLLTRGELRATLAVVTTDYDFQGLWLSSPFNRFFVARDETRAYMVELGLPADRISVSGIPVKAEFSQVVEREAVLARYGLRPDLPTLLISAGAAGGAYTQAIVAQTLQMRNAFQAVIVCGRNAQLKDEIEALVAPHADRYRVVGYTTDMPDLMQIATLFVGKPGGLSSSECMAAGLPMALIKPIPGQEVRNSDFLLEEGAAVRCNYETTVGYKIDQLLDDPDRMRRMAASARKLGRPDAAHLVVETVLADPPTPLWISRAAQQAILAAAEQGVSAREGDADHRVQTLIDATTGISVGVVTMAQIQTLAQHVAAEAIFDAALSVTPALLAQLKQRGVDPDLLVILRQALGTATDVTVALGD
ncbi:MAG TPA: glycosyltransferase [Roseiflexaceae bacterium]|nr:glycosyltransferase [Roseiflexaceae bacterium]